MIEWESIPWGLVAPLIAVHLILLTVALVDCIRSEQTKGPKWLWIIIIVFINMLGPVLYFVFGRRQH